MKPLGGIMETAIYADDLEAAEQFYGEVFGLEMVRRLPGQFVFFRCGQQMLLIFDPEKSHKADERNPIPRHGTAGQGHFCFRVKTVRRSMHGAIVSSLSALLSNITIAGAMTAGRSTSATPQEIRSRWAKDDFGASTECPLIKAPPVSSRDPDRSYHQIRSDGRQSLLPHRRQAGFSAPGQNQRLRFRIRRPPPASRHLRRKALQCRTCGHARRPVHGTIHI